ncbi:hypothetical protein SSX86_030505 [Deinandra increscens subsp. villosa]|uniref:NB-ARC domain-containing protein n=1 Tax=Deinandra increscens subsp. villosa TaxID=3103831 RepID=A0AAP0CAR6_9ASTR
MFRLETELLEELVNDIYARLGVPLGTSGLPLLIGMEYDIESITSWLKDRSSNTTDILTILGMGGIGKTCLANYIYELHRGEYTSSFIGDISRRCAGEYHGLLNLQKQLYGDISKRNLTRDYDVSGYTSKIWNMLARGKTLLVLDDIDSLDQLDGLLGNQGLHPRSKIIITTKDASLIERCALFKTKVKPSHTKCTLKGLSEGASLQVLCLHAFTQKYPIEGYEEVSINLARYCGGHPLALVVLGKSLHNRDVCEWEDSIDMLMKEPDSRIGKVLQMSFDSLPSKNDKDLFKHIACFFVRMDRYFTETILNACALNTRSGIRNLIDKCLLSIDWNNKLIMHQLVQEMGRDLIRQESPEKPWKRSRLWCHEESLSVFKQKKGLRNVLGLALDMRTLEKKVCGSLELKTAVINNIESFDMSSNNPQPLRKRQKRLVGSGSKDKQLLGSLKILNLSFCEQLHRLGGFFELPALEKLIVRNCIRLLEVCESVEKCVELVHIDLSYCYKLKMLPLSLGNLKKIKTLLLDGCSSGESQIKMWDMNSTHISMNSQTSLSPIMKAIPRESKFFTSSLPTTLIFLSLANNNLSNDSFPMDFSCLSMLKELCLDNNPIVSMPNCVSTLPRLEELNMESCKMLISIEYPPRTLRVLSIENHSIQDYSLKKIKFDPDMCPLNLYGAWKLLSHSSIEIDGMVEVQPVADVDERVLHSLGWTKSEFIKEKELGTYTFRGSDTSSQTKMYYEFGVFSIICEGKRRPNWIAQRSRGSSISFTIPSSPKEIRGLNFCCVEKHPHYSFVLPMIKISNITKNHTWIYDHYIDEVKLGGKCLSLLSHWMFGPNEMTGGDQITITVIRKTNGYYDQLTRECGIGLVYDEDEKMEEGEDVLSYYKSWNHIIGGDLSAFQLTTGEYILDNMQFLRYSSKIGSRYLPFIHDGGFYKVEEVGFKAFSERKSNILGSGSRVFIEEVE